MLTSSVNNVGAYGTPQFTTPFYPPESSYAGMFVNPLKKCGENIDEIYIKGYDAGSKYNPLNAYEAYKSIYKGDIILGLEITVNSFNDSLKYAEYIKKNKGKGIIISPLLKSSANYSTSCLYLTSTCILYGYSSSCSEISPSM